MNETRKILITGAEGFIGSAFVRLAESNGFTCASFDLLSDGSHPMNLEGTSCRRFSGDIRDTETFEDAVNVFNPDWIVHFAAESHVDRSILAPIAFVETNVLGSATVLEAARKHWQGLSGQRKENFRLLMVSTDEVFGSLQAEDQPFSETTPLAPNSPYSASKAAADLLSRAWHRTYGLPVLWTNCSNNYGPRQFPEKLIPKTILLAAAGEMIPVYGTGMQVRDWLHVDDHCRGILAALEKGVLGESYCFGGNGEKDNLSMVELLCDQIDEKLGPLLSGPRRKLVTFVTDRPGHDFRYAIDCSKSKNDLSWSPLVHLKRGLAETVGWYLDNSDWVVKAKKLSILRNKPSDAAFDKHKVENDK